MLLYTREKEKFLPQIGTYYYKLIYCTDKNKLKNQLLFLFFSINLIISEKIVAYHLKLSVVIFCDLLQIFS